jgi:hypothetical protein
MMRKKLIFLICLLSFGLVLASAGIASAEMVAHFNFNGAAGTTVRDVTGKGHDGTIVGNITLVPGKFGKCMVDDGTGYIALAPATGTDIQIGGRNCTIAAWIQTTSTQAMPIVGKLNPAAGGTHEAQDHTMGVNYSAGVFTVDNGWVDSVTEMLRDKPLSCV